MHGMHGNNIHDMHDIQGMHGIYSMHVKCTEYMVCVACVVSVKCRCQSIGYSNLVKCDYKCEIILQNNLCHAQVLAFFFLLNSV